MIYIFDFDGVLFNTVNELAVVTYTYLKNLETKPQNVPEEYKEFFRINRCYPVDGAGMVIVAKFCIEELEKGKKPYLFEKKMFLDLYEKSLSKKQDFEREFANKRQNFSKKNTATWLSLNPPYKEIWEFLKDKKFYIVSNKDKRSIKILTSAFEHDIEDNFIFSSDEKGNKAEKILQIYNQEQEECTFVDDALDNLLSIKNNSILKDILPNKLNLIHAGWGYVSKEDKDLSKSEDLIKYIETENEFIKLYK